MSKPAGIDMKVSEKGTVTVKQKDLMALPEAERRKVYAAMREKHAAAKPKIAPPTVLAEAPMGGAGGPAPKAKPAKASAKIDEYIIHKDHGTMSGFPIKQNFNLFGGAMGREGLVPSTGSLLKAIKTAIREVFGVSGVPAGLPENLHNNSEYMKGDGDIKIFKTGKRLDWMNLAPESGKPNSGSGKQTEIGNRLAAAIKAAHAGASIVR